MIRLFTGWDAREAVGFSSFIQSVLANTTSRISITPLHSQQFDGSNAFTYARYTAPMLCNYEGWAIFADGCDMICRADLAELWALCDPRYAVQVVQHDYVSNAPRKYMGTAMESPNVHYPRKNWSSLMLMNCAHPSMRQIPTDHPKTIHQFPWLKDEEIGALPVEWNWLCDEYGANHDAKICHWTQGIPGFAWYKQSPMANVWHAYHADANAGDSAVLEQTGFHL